MDNYAQVCTHKQKEKKKKQQSDYYWELTDFGQRRWFWKPLHFNPLCSSMTMTWNNPCEEERFMSCICWASHQAVPTFQPQRDGRQRTAAGERNGEAAQEGRTDSSSAHRKKRQRHRAGTESPAETDLGTRALQTREQMPRGNGRSPSASNEKPS